jgi:predicted RNA-binding Zn-ribbon protein involved in translation (DUF1610 family)
MEAFNAGTLAGAGSFRCDSCGFPVAFHEGDEVPACPACGGTSFMRAPLFTRDTTTEFDHPEVDGPPAWLEEARARLTATGCHLAYADDDGPRTLALDAGWTRIGRSLAADVRFDDPTVSRRHALVYCDDDGARILDDRSLNGVFVNGDRVELAELSDGDEVAIGRFRLYVMVPSEARERPPAGVFAG